MRQPAAGIGRWSLIVELPRVERVTIGAGAFAPTVPSLMVTHARMCGSSGRRSIGMTELNFPALPGDSACG
jgi:hypothetical protein